MCCLPSVGGQRPSQKSTSWTLHFALVLVPSSKSSHLASFKHPFEKLGGSNLKLLTKLSSVVPLAQTRYIISLASMSALQNEALPTPEQTIQASLILLEAEIGQRTSAVSKLPASLVGGDVATEARDVLINGNMWEWRKTFHLKLPASSQIDKPICVLTIGSGLECNIALQSDEILAVHCRVYAQLNSNFDCWILENLSETVIQYSDDDRYFSEFNALIPSEEVCLEHLSQGRIALHRLRGLVVGPFKLNLRVPSGKQETKQRASWFRLNLPGLVSKEMLREQTQGRDLHRADFEVIRLVGRGDLAE